MKIFGRLETYLYTAAASAVMVYTAHNPAWHDTAIWLLGVIGHAIGVASTQPPTAPAAPEAASGSGG